MYHTDVIYNPDDDLIDELRLALKKADEATVGSYESRSAIVCLRDHQQKMIAGAHVYFEVGCLHLDVLWVHEDYRKMGLGSQLLQACEKTATQNNVNRCWLSTNAFQALDFYKKQGYTVFGEFDIDTPQGQSKNYFLTKQLQ